MTGTKAVIDIFVDRLPRANIRQRFKAGTYGKLKPEYLKGWLEIRDGTGTTTESR